MTSNSYLTELDLAPDETRELLELATYLKKERQLGEYRVALRGKGVALYFEKPSTRTRTSFTMGVQELGGHVVELTSKETKVDKGEDVADFAKVLGRYVRLIVARVFSQERLHVMAEYSGVPVINALSDERHPCQALADVLTIIEKKGRIEGVRFAFVGEGNNVAISTGLLCAALGADVRIASPKGYGVPESILELSKGLEGKFVQVEDPHEAAHQADAIYTDTWISMGQEDEAEMRRKLFGSYKVDSKLMASADAECIVMHCLPAVRGEEIDADLMYAPCSAIWDQAENRLHAQKALMLHCLRQTV